MQTTMHSAQASKSLLRSPTITVARLALESYFRSGWMWGEFVLVLVFFAALFFPFQENVAYFNGTSNYDLGFIAVLGAVALVRQSTSARTYLLLARLTTRSAYSRGLMLATVALRLPLYVLFLVLVLLFHRLTDPAFMSLFWGAVGLLPNVMLAGIVTIALCSPMATRLKRICFLTWLALVLFSISPVFLIPASVYNALGIVRIPLWPVVVCGNLSVTGNFGWQSVLGLALVLLYAAFIAWLAGYWLERRELLLY